MTVDRDPEASLPPPPDEAEEDPDGIDVMEGFSENPTIEEPTEHLQIDTSVPDYDQEAHVFPDWFDQTRSASGKDFNVDEWVETMHSRATPWRSCKSGRIRQGRRGQARGDHRRDLRQVPRALRRTARHRGRHEGLGRAAR